MNRWVAFVVVGVVVSIVGVGVVAANEAPDPSAGLDQDVEEGTTVYLDAGGSLDPDGSIEAYRWTITDPNGSTVAPDCRSCARTQFLAEEDGQYNATVTVTDDDGATRSDTLYVTATPVEPPTVSVSGPSSVENDSTAAFDASATAGDTELATLIWRADGTEVARRDVSGEEAAKSVKIGFEETGETRLQVEAVDVSGMDVADSQAVTVDPVQTETQTQAESSETNSGTPDGYASMLRRTDESYEVLMPRGVVDGRGSGDMLDQGEVTDLKRISGVETTSVVTNTGPVEALSITNPNLKDDIDKEAGQRGAGFLDSFNEYINPDSSTYEVSTKTQLEKPGVNWERSGRVKTGTKTTSDPVDKDHYELIETIEETSSQTYTAETPRDQNDRQVGHDREYDTHWQSTYPAGGDYIEKYQTLDHYTWTETRTRFERVRTGTRLVDKGPRYGWKTVERTETRAVCTNRITQVWYEPCLEWDTIEVQTTETIWGVVGRWTVSEPTYETRTYTETVRKSGISPPQDASNVTPHYNTRYKVREVTSSTPIWQPVTTKYRYEVYTYEWERVDL